MRLPQLLFQAPVDGSLPGQGGVLGEEGVKLGPHVLLEGVVAPVQGAGSHKSSHLCKHLARRKKGYGPDTALLPNVQ